MNRDQFDKFCESLKATTHVIQWGGASVWKVGGKIFAICANHGDGPEDKISFKCSDFSYEILTQQAHIIPAPYLARAKWVQVTDEAAMTEDEVKQFIEEAHEIIVGKLTKAQRKELGF